MADLAADLDSAAVRAMALARLLDRVIKLEPIIASTRPPRPITIQYEYPNGTVHDIPPWKHPDYSSDL
jgi:hypothetical protein